MKSFKPIVLPHVFWLKILLRVYKAERLGRHEAAESRLNGTGIIIENIYFAFNIIVSEPTLTTRPTYTINQLNNQAVQFYLLKCLSRALG
jgi:hypothetical protein